MIGMKDYDADSYELEFEEDTPAEERNFYVKTYPNVNMVADKRLHCTTCNTHLGCAVANELTIRMHPVLRVTHCKKCHTFYNSGEFSKGEDGSELYCRWCGQGGEVYCCAKCPYVFCKKCIVQNLSRSMVTEIENNDNWNCFACSPNVMWPLRSQHWALVNYIEKTKKRILSEEKDDDKIYELMNKDPSMCCRDKKAHKSRKDTKKKRKRRYSSTSSSGCSTPEPKRIQDHSAILPKMVAPSAQQKKSTKSLDELVCTPDILSMFSEPAEEATAPVAPSPKPTTPSVPTTVSQKTTATSQPPPLIIRQLPTSSQVQTVRFPNRQFSAVPRVAPPPPAYYTVNGFRVDLNAAAQQETYRLPNGKLIQVKKQTAANQVNANNSNRNTLPLQSRSNNANPNPYSIRFNIQPSIPTAPLQIQQAHHVPPIVHQPAAPVHSTTASAAATLHQQHLQQQQQILNGVGLTNLPMIPMNNTTPLLARYPNTPLGQSQTELEKQIHGAQEICQQIVGKCNTLMKSNAYKSVRNFNDVKDLHLHLSYLFTYTIDKFTTLQSKCTDEMKSLTNAHEAANKLADKKNKYTNVDDDLEVVEPTTVCIEIDSDDENEPKKSASETVPATTNKTKQPRKTNHQPKSNSAESINVEVIAPIEIIDNIDADDLELPTPPALEPELSTPLAIEPELPITPALELETPTLESESLTSNLEPELLAPSALESLLTYDCRNDKKLKSLPKVVLEKDEEVERKLKEIMEKEKESSENGAASPVNDEIVNESVNESVVEVNESMDTSGSTIDESVSKVNAEHRPEGEGNKDDASEKGDKDDASEKSDKDDVSEKGDKDDLSEKGDKDDVSEKGDKDDKSEKGEKDDKSEKGDKEDKSEKGDDITNGQSNDEEMLVECSLNNTDLSCPESPALTDNLDNDLDEMDHQNNLTDNSFENISSPDMFDDMSKNGFDKTTENIVTLSTENADPDLV